MNLKNLMEDKQLDFNRPLLSVRRVSSTAVSSQVDNKKKTDKSIPSIPPLPFYRSELKSGPVSNPGTVPFVWEQAPGRPKDESKAKTRALQQPHTPKLPPGRFPNVKQKTFDKFSESTAVTESKTENVVPRSQNVLSLDETVTKHESTEEKVELEEFSSSEDGDEAYLDALDTISRTESFCMNCSISGLSGLDVPDVKPSGSFSTDPQARDFMMGRFLPAAKAMASETPPHASWKQPVQREQLRQGEKVVSRDRRSPCNHYGQNFVPQYAHNNDGEESENEADDYDGSETSSAKVCGLLPRFCLSNSFCLLNPVPGMRMQSSRKVSSVRRVRAKSSYSVSRSEPEKEHGGAAVHEQRSLNGHQKAEPHEDRNEQKSESNQITYKSDCEKPDQSPLHRRLQGNGKSPCQNKNSQSLHEERGFLGMPEKVKNSKVNGSNPNRKGPYLFRELLAIESNDWESGSESPVVEKTLYIDSVHTVASRKSNASSSDGKSLTDYREDNLGILAKSSEMEKTPAVDSSLENFKHLSVVDEAKVQTKSSSVEACFLSFLDRSKDDIQVQLINFSKQDQDLIRDSLSLTSSKAADTKKINQESQQSLKSGSREGGITLTSLKVADNDNIGLESQGPKKRGTRQSSHGLQIQDSVTLASSKVSDNEKINLESQLAIKGYGNYPQLHIGPPLPKSPSESWLKRTLPTISSKNLPSRSSLAMGIHTSNQGSKTTSLDSKWETIVKTSNVHPGHLRFSEELTPIPEA